VTFAHAETAGIAELDEMVGGFPGMKYNTLTSLSQYAYQADIGMYRDVLVPNPELVALGATFGTIDEAIAAEIVPRYS
jgi:hypothetical protein